MGSTNTPSYGFTVVEVLVALAILAIVIATSTSSFVQYVRNNHNAEIRAEAAQAGQTVLDEIRRLPVEDLRSSGTETRNVTVNSAREYSVAVQFCLNTAYCSSGEVRHMTVAVTHKNEIVYRTETVYTDLGDANGGESDTNSTTTVATTSTTTSVSTSTTTSSVSTSTTSTSTSSRTTSRATTSRTTTTSVTVGGGGCRHYRC